MPGAQSRDGHVPSLESPAPLRNIQCSVITKGHRQFTDRNHPLNPLSLDDHWPVSDDTPDIWLNSPANVPSFHPILTDYLVLCPSDIW